MSDEQTTKCPICQYDCHIKISSDLNEIKEINCPVCGIYYATDNFLRFFRDEIDLHRIRDIAGILRIRSEKHLNTILYSNNDKKIIDKNFFNKKNLIKQNFHIIPKNTEEKIMLILNFLKLKSNFFGEEIEINYYYDFSICFAKHPQEFDNFLKLAHRLEYINLNSLHENQSSIQKFHLTEIGEKKNQDIRVENSKLNQAFLATWIPDSETEESFLIQRKIETIKKTIEKANFEMMHINTAVFSDDVLENALAEIRKSRFIIIDLTNAKTGIYLEVGFALGLNKEIIFIQEKKDNVRYHYAQLFNVLYYDNNLDLENKLYNAIEARIC